MGLTEKKEQQILLLSLGASVLFVAAEFVMAWRSGSRSVLMDSAFDGVELVITGISVMLAPLLYCPVTEKRPFGYAQCESLFLIVKGFMLGLVTVSQIVSNIRLMLAGGNHINTAAVAWFESAVAAACLVMMLLLRHTDPSGRSPILRAEVYGWRVDTISSLCVAIAFFLPPLFAGTAVARFIPYLDQVVAIALSAMMLPRPIRMVIVSLRDLLLFAPPQPAVQALHDQVLQLCRQAGFDLDFLDLVQTGRKTWAEVTVRCRSEETTTVHQLRELYQTLLPVFAGAFTDVELEVIPALDKPAAALPAADTPPAR